MARLGLDRRDTLVRSIRALAVLAVFGLAGAVLGASMTSHYFAYALCLTLAGLLAALAFFDARVAITGTLTFVLLLGIERRAFQYGFRTGAPTVDPLFLIAPAATLALLAVAARRGAFKQRTPLSSVVLGLCLIGIVGALNPLQGSLVAGGVGLVIFITPLLWFWIGRGLVDDARMSQALFLAAAIGTLAAVYGLLQTNGHFFSWDQAWVDAAQAYAALRIQSFVRGFGFSSSAAEYGKLLGVSVSILASYLFAKHRVWWLPAMGVLGWALFLSGLRTTLVLAVVAVGIVWGTRRGASVLQLTIYGLLALVVLFLAAGQVAPSAGGGGDAASVLADRQVTGLTDPFNSRSSTLQAHISLAGKALTGMAGAPIGQGTATITIAGKRFGASAAGDTDLADAAIAFGLAGVVLYLLLCIRLFRQAHLLAVHRGDIVSLAALGIVVVSSLQWLNGGLYAANIFAWLTFGWIDRASAELPDRSTPKPDSAARGRPTVAV